MAQCVDKGWPQHCAPVSEPGFLDFQIFDSRDEENNKRVLERPWTKWRVLRAISSTLKFQFTVKS